MLKLGTRTRKKIWIFWHTDTGIILQFRWVHRVCCCCCVDTVRFFWIVGIFGWLTVARLKRTEDHSEGDDDGRRAHAGSAPHDRTTRWQFGTEQELEQDHDQELAYQPSREPESSNPRQPDSPKGRRPEGPNAPKNRESFLLCASVLVAVALDEKEEEVLGRICATVTKKNL